MGIKNLLDINTENHFDIASIKLYYLVDGIPVEVNNPMYDAPKGFSISNEKRNGKFVLGLSLNATNNINRGNFEATTYLQLSNSDTDTIVCEFSKETNSLICKKVIYNGSNVWQWNSERFITIEK